MENHTKQQEQNIKYEEDIVSNKNHKMHIEISSNKNNLEIKSFFIEDYFVKTTFTGKFTLEELSKNSDYYKQFKDTNMIIEEIIGYKREEKIIIEEENEQIKIIIPTSSTIFKTLSFILKLCHKTDVEKIEEYEKALKRFKEDNLKLENRFIIEGLETKIAKEKEQMEIIKMWISPFNDIKANLIYSFYRENCNDFKNKYSKYKNLEDVNSFHEKCDNKQNLLVLCKSKNEIFGGFTPLCFSNDDSYGYDNESFVFSINKLKKYPKEDQQKSCSIWKYNNYGPCFSYDLCFEEHSMNKIYFEQKRYTIPEDFINKANCYTQDGYIILDSLEVFKLDF